MAKKVQREMPPIPPMSDKIAGAVFQASVGNQEHPIGHGMVVLVTANQSPSFIGKVFRVSNEYGGWRYDILREDGTVKEYVHYANVHGPHSQQAQSIIGRLTARRDRAQGVLDKFEFGWAMVAEQKLTKLGKTQLAKWKQETARAE